MGITPRAYADARRIDSLRQGLQDGHSVTRAMYDAGYGSSSRLYERTSSQLGMTPAAYRKRGSGAAIQFAIGESPLGWLLVAVTARGVCRIRFGETAAELEQEFREEFALAELRREDAGTLPWFADVLRYLEGQQAHLDLPLDIRTTAFQRMVWEYLQTIPYGRTQSYAEVAKALGRPAATRAVARACATNPVGPIVPCHRVVASDGKLTGYRWGLKRKRALLDLEQRPLP
jgi:AraC family transcriptional regulator of adaptative response/methylated-DNA-[protein]-cysteine methyltransferase